MVHPVDAVLVQSSPLFPMLFRLTSGRVHLLGELILFWRFLHFFGLFYKLLDSWQKSFALANSIFTARRSGVLLHRIAAVLVQSSLVLFSVSPTKFSNFDNRPAFIYSIANSQQFCLWSCSAMIFSCWYAFWAAGIHSQSNDWLALFGRLPLSFDLFLISIADRYSGVQLPIFHDTFLYRQVLLSIFSSVAR